MRSNYGRPKVKSTMQPWTQGFHIWWSYKILAFLGTQQCFRQPWCLDSLSRMMIQDRLALTQQGFQMGSPLYKRRKWKALYIHLHCSPFQWRISWRLLHHRNLPCRYANASQLDLHLRLDFLCGSKRFSVSGLLTINCVDERGGTCTKAFKVGALDERWRSLLRMSTRRSCRFQLQGSIAANFLMQIQ